MNEAILEDFRHQRRVSPWRFVRRWPIIPLIVLTALAAVGIGAPWLAPTNPIYQSLPAHNSPPFWQEGSIYLLGGDHVGRDVFSRIVYGARISLTVMVVALASGLIVGTSLGLLSGYFGGMVDEIITRVVDIWLGFPFLLLALVVAVVIGATFVTVMALMALLAWSTFVRNVRADVLLIKQSDYVSLARVAGASHFRVIARHVLPGTIGTITVIASLSVGQLIMAEATLSFLGAGIPAPTPSWGNMIAEGRSHLQTAWWTSTFPGLALFLTVMSLNFFGDWLRDRLDPRLRQLA